MRSTYSMVRQGLLQAAELQQFRELESRIRGSQPKSGGLGGGAVASSGISMVRREQMGRIKSLTGQATPKAAAPTAKGGGNSFSIFAGDLRLFYPANDLATQLCLEYFAIPKTVSSCGISHALKCAGLEHPSIRHITHWYQIECTSLRCLLLKWVANQ